MVSMFYSSFDASLYCGIQATSDKKATAERLQIEEWLIIFKNEIP